MTDALVLVDVKALAALSPDERVAAIATAYSKWGRIKVDVAWAFGCALSDIRHDYSKGSGDWGRVLDTIGIDHQKARRFMRIAEHDSVQIKRYPTVDAAYKALASKRPALEPAPVVATPAPAPAPASPPVEPDPTQESVIDAMAAELEPTAAELRDRVELLEERIAILLEAEEDDGAAVDAAFAARDAEKQAHARTHADRNQVLARERKKDRLIAGIKREWLAGKSGDDMLATFFGLSRKTARTAA